MAAWRLALAGLLAALVAPPLAAPLALPIRDPGAWRVWADAGRLAALAGNTLALTALTLLLALPAGIALAIVLDRTDLPCRAAWRRAVLLPLFVPLPLLAAGWQTAVAALRVPAWAGPRGAAALIHAVAALPWVVLLVGLGVRGVGREQEEDALTAASPARVVWRVTLPGCATAIAAAALWVALQTATEVSVTDLYQVRTIAEETYTQFVAPEPAGPDDALARAVAVALPFAAGLAAVVVAAARRWDRELRTADSPGRPLTFPLGRWRRPLTVAVALAVAVGFGVPVGNLVWRAGVAGASPGWSPGQFVSRLVQTARTDGTLIGRGLGLAAVVGAATAALALAACWAARGSPRSRAALFVLAAFAWAMPAPVVGLGLREVIAGLLDATGSRRLEAALYGGPSPLPLLWADLVRLFPFAVALLWPAVRAVPRERTDAARVDGAGPAGEFRHVVWPAVRGAWGRAALATGVLSLGELGAGKLVSTPGWPGYAEVLFQRLHYGVTSDLAAGCLLLLIVVTAGGCVALAWRAGERKV